MGLRAQWRPRGRHTVTTEVRVLLSASAHRLPGWRSHRRTLRPARLRTNAKGWRSGAEKTALLSYQVPLHRRVHVDIAHRLRELEPRSQSQRRARSPPSEGTHALPRLGRAVWQRSIGDSLAGQQCGQQRSLTTHSAATGASMGLRRSNHPVAPSSHLTRSHLTRSHLAVSHLAVSHLSLSHLALSHFKLAGPQSSSRTLSNDSGSSRVHLLSDGVLHTCCCADGSNPRGCSQGGRLSSALPWPCAARGSERPLARW